jgi:hypothetical protein
MTGWFSCHHLCFYVIICVGFKEGGGRFFQRILIYIFYFKEKQFGIGILFGREFFFLKKGKKFGLQKRIRFASLSEMSRLATGRIIRERSEQILLLYIISYLYNIHIWQKP